ncbi:MAG: hypothetical protein IPO81_00800 [Kouleothrix sp.]|nr:hypothetical protein [Kouleothrix sp.]
MSSPIWWLVLGLLIGWLIEWVIDWLYWRRRRQSNEMDTQGARQAGAELARMRDSLASTRADNQRLQADLSAATASAQQRDATIGELEARLASMRADVKQRSVGPEAPRAPVVLSADDGAAKATSFATVQLSREDMASLESPADRAAANVPKTGDAQLPREREVAQPAARPRDPLIDINGIGPAYERKLFDGGVYTFEELAALTPEQVRAIIAPQHWQEIDPAAWIAEARQFAQKKVAL